MSGFRAYLKMSAQHVLLQGSAAVEPMQVDAEPLAEENENVGGPHQFTVENPTLDPEQIASQYEGLVRLQRLIFIADHCPSLRIEALRLVLKYIKGTSDTRLYAVIHHRFQDAVAESGPLPDAVMSVVKAFLPMDVSWVEATEKKAALKLEKLDADLKSYKCNSIKESIRRGQDDLGDHHVDCGNLTGALKCYSRARDYCTGPKNIINMCLNVIKVSVYLQNWSHVLSYVNKAESTPPETSGKELSQKVQGRLKCAAGLAHMATGCYQLAAKHFLQISFEHFEYSEVLSQSSLATYGTLCALASFDRRELQNQVITSTSFKQFLELEPHLLEVLHSFYDSKYTSCLTMLAEMKDNLLLDLYLSVHVEYLYAEIRNRALCQYFSPYLSADMRKMASAFNTTVGALEEELMRLIMDDQINARIDSHNKILYAKETDQRSSIFEKSLAIGRDYRRRTTALMLRSAVLRNQIQVKMSTADKNSKAFMAFECQEES